METHRNAQASVDKITKPRCREAVAAAVWVSEVNIVKDQGQMVSQEHEQVTVEEGGDKSGAQVKLNRQSGVAAWWP